jgi:hypothetical protein
MRHYLDELPFKFGDIINSLEQEAYNAGEDTATRLLFLMTATSHLEQFLVEFQRFRDHELQHQILAHLKFPINGKLPWRSSLR